MFSVLPRPNMALNLAPFGRRTVRDKAAQRRLALRQNCLNLLPENGAWLSESEFVKPDGRISRAEGETIIDASMNALERIFA